MNAVPAGIVLPSSVLSSEAFIVLSLVVAFNTIIYVGLTLSKLFPWPRQFHPSRVRRWLTSLGYDVEAIPVSDMPDQDSSVDPYVSIRLGVARRDVPRAFALFGGLMALIAAVSMIVLRESTIWPDLVGIAAGAMYLVLGAVTGRRKLNARTIVAMWIVCSTLVVTALIVQAGISESLSPMGFSIVLMTAFAPVALSTAPTLIASAVMLGAVTGVSAVVPDVQGFRFLLAAIGALLVGQVLLRLRIVALDAIVAERLKSQSLVATDATTGLFTPTSLYALLPTLAGTAERQLMHVSVMLVSVPDINRAAHDYGADYSETVVRSVADSIRRGARLGDLVARWQHDRFVIVGIGEAPSPSGLAQRIEAGVADSGISLGKWPITVQVGVATGAPGTATFDDLLEKASLAVVESS